MNLKNLVLSGLAAAAIVAAPVAASAQDQRSYVLTTATTGGVYYPVGVAIATLIKVKLQAAEGIDMSAISSAGSTENVSLLAQDQAQFGILVGLVASFAANGEPPFQDEGPQENLRGVAGLWNNYEQFVVDRSIVDTGRIGDLKNLYGKRFSIGARASGLETNNRWMFRNLGIDPEKFELVYQGYGPSSEGLQNGTIQGANFEAGLPTASVTQAFAQAGNRLAFLQFNEEDLKQVNGESGPLVLATIPAGTYPGQDEDISTTAQPNFLVTNADVPEEDVYKITKTIFENLPFLNNIHAATREMSLDTAIDGFPMPLHPGAVRYYQEAGLDVPEHLIP
jgi:TRAP transporter TAXI family solute receptor